MHFINDSQHSLVRSQTVNLFSQTMVQHSRIPGVWIDINIQVEGARYEEAEAFMPPSDFTHQSESIAEDLPLVTRFIESKSGKEYTIKYATTSEFIFEKGCDTLLATVIIDGGCVTGEVIRKGSDKTSTCGELEMINYNDADGVTQTSRMTFSEIPTGKHLFTQVLRYQRP